MAYDNQLTFIPYWTDASSLIACLRDRGVNPQMDLHTRFRNSRTRVATLAAAFVLAVGIVSVPAFPAAAAPATHLTVTTNLSGDATAGVAFDLTVTAYDDTPEVDTSYSGTVHFSGGGANAILPADSLLTDGTVTLQATLEEAGQQTIAATDIGSPSITGDVDVTVGPAAPASIAFVDKPDDGTYVNKNAGPVSVEILDSFGNRTTSDAAVDLSLDDSSSGTGSLSGDTSAAAVNGLATFASMSVDSDGQYTLLAQSSPTDAVETTPLEALSDFTILPWADLQLSLSSDPSGTIGEDVGQVVAGERVTYHVLVENYGPSMNSSYDLNLEAPAGVLAANSLPSGCTGAGTHIVSCTRSSIDGPTGETPESDAFDVVFDVPSSFVDGADLTTSGSIDNTDPTQLDGLKPDQDISDTQIVTTRADLSPSLTTAATPQIAGASAGFDYSLAVHNAGPSDNTGGYNAVFTLPSGVTFVSTGSSPTCSAAGAVVTCTDNTGILSGPTDETFTIHAKIAPSEPAGPHDSTATVTTAGTDDPTPGNNTSAAATVNVITRANLSITKGAVAQLGGAAQDLAYANTNVLQNRVTFTVTVSNATTSSAGPSDAQSVSVTDTLPAGTTLVSASPAADCSGSTTVTCSNGAPLAPGASRTYTIVVSVNASLRGGETNNFTNTATVTSPTKDITTNAATSKSATSGTIRVHTVPDSPANPKASPGNGNAFFQWTQVTTANGGENIDVFRVASTPSGPSIADVSVNDPCGTPNTKTIFCTNVVPLTNGTTYTFSVRAHNAVGYSDPSGTSSAIPSIDASAKQISNGGSQSTGNGNTSVADKQVFAQDFGATSGYFGIGTILENSAEASNFCGGSTCIGKVGVTKLLDPTVGQGIYKITLLYDKTLIGGTGQKYQAYYLADDATTTLTTGHLIPTCNKTFSNFPCSVIKLGNQGANPALKIEIYTTDVDPTTGGKILK
jgi:uncharacterized repeat protein (TIGR01451 family)